MIVIFSHNCCKHQTQESYLLSLTAFIFLSSFAFVVFFILFHLLLPFFFVSFSSLFLFLFFIFSFPSPFLYLFFSFSFSFLFLLFFFSFSSPFLFFSYLFLFFFFSVSFPSLFFFFFFFFSFFFPSPSPFFFFFFILLIVRGTIEGELALEMSALNNTIVSLQTQIQLKDRKINAGEARGDEKMFLLIYSFCLLIFSIHLLNCF